MKIFIIEDELAIREELIELLLKYGYECGSSVLTWHREKQNLEI